MDLDTALAAHSDWKVNLRIAISSQKTLDASRIASDCQCDFGRWLKGDGRVAHASSPSFKLCDTSHTEFHRCAGKIAEMINRKDLAGAAEQLEAGTPFSRASQSVALAIRRLKNEILQPA